MSENLIESMGRRIIARRKQLRLTQDELAEKADMTPQTISTAELGKKALRPENLLKLCIALDISVDFLLTGEVIDKDEFLLNRKVGSLTAEQFHHLEDIINSFLAVCSTDE